MNAVNQPLLGKLQSHMATAQLLLNTPWLLEVGAMALQTAKVHIKVCSLQGRVEIFFPWTDMEPASYSVLAQ